MVALKHTIWKEGVRTVHFYDGQLEAKDGVVKIPADNPAWIRRAWILGYRLNPRTGENIPYSELIQPEEAPDVEKSSDSRRRTPSEDGVRTNQRSRSK